VNSVSPPFQRRLQRDGRMLSVLFAWEQGSPTVEVEQQLSASVRSGGLVSRLVAW
jgi:hypothetical protein